MTTLQLLEEMSITARQLSMLIVNVGITKSTLQVAKELKAEIALLEQLCEGKGDSNGD